MNVLALTSLAALGFGLSGCITVGPNYKKPDTSAITPAEWSWQPAAPRDDCCA